MDTNDFISQVLKFWPSSFKPADSWRIELLTAIAHLTPSQLELGLKALKSDKGGKKITLTVVVDTCASIGFKQQSVSVFNALRRPPGSYVEPLRIFLKAQNAWKDYLRMPIEAQVMIGRFYAELWGGTNGEAQMIAIMNDGPEHQPWVRLERLETEARKDPRVRGTYGGWYPSWSDRSLAS